MILFYYRDFIGTCRYIEDTHSFYGEVQDTQNPVLTYEAPDFPCLKDAFHKTVDWHLRQHADRNISCSQPM